jgi:hypothetical protein
MSMLGSGRAASSSGQALDRRGLVVVDEHRCKDPGGCASSVLGSETTAPKPPCSPVDRGRRLHQSSATAPGGEVGQREAGRSGRCRAGALAPAAPTTSPRFLGVPPTTKRKWLARSSKTERAADTRRRVLHVHHAHYPTAVPPGDATARGQARATTRRALAAVVVLAPHAMVFALVGHLGPSRSSAVAHSHHDVSSPEKDQTHPL